MDGSLVSIVLLLTIICALIIDHVLNISSEKTLLHFSTDDAIQHAKKSTSIPSTVLTINNCYYKV